MWRRLITSAEVDHRRLWGLVDYLAGCHSSRKAHWTAPTQCMFTADQPVVDTAQANRTARARVMQYAKRHLPNQQRQRLTQQHHRHGLRMAPRGLCHRLLHHIKSHQESAHYHKKAPMLRS